jgi:hypothetical protein
MEITLRDAVDKFLSSKVEKNSPKVDVHEEDCYG